MDLATGKATQLTDGPAVDSRPRWSPDGKKLAIVRDSGADTAIVILNLRNFFDSTKSLLFTSNSNNCRYNIIFR